MISGGNTRVKLEADAIVPGNGIPARLQIFLHIAKEAFVFFFFGWLVWASNPQLDGMEETTITKALTTPEILF